MSLNIDVFYRIVWIFFMYSFLGWICETSIAIIKRRKFVNRGILDGPVCCIYGFSAVAITIVLSDQKNSLIVLFVGSLILSTFIEWISGHLFEKIKHRKLWDYSNKRWNLDGYICVRYSVLWGIMGMLGVRFINPLLVTLYKSLEGSFLNIIIICAIIVLIVDAIGTYAGILGIRKKMPNIEKVNNRLAKLTLNPNYHE